MNKLKQAILFVTITVLFVSCSRERTLPEFEEQFNNNMQEFSVTATQFLNQDEIAGLTISVNGIECDELNAWRRCPDIKEEWEMWSTIENKFVNVPDLKSVLLNENILDDSYQYFVSFLTSQNIQSIRKLPGGWVEFDDAKMGLRFNSSPNVSFTDGLKYENVRMLNSNWYLYEKKTEE